MPERERKQKPAPKEREEVVEDVPATSERGEKLKEDIDDLLDEIDSVLEDNAEEFVRNYVQKGRGVTRSGHSVSPDAKRLQALRVGEQAARRLLREPRARDGRPSRRVQGMQPRASASEVRREPAAAHRAGAAMAAREPGARTRRSMREYAESGKKKIVGPQEPPEAEVRAHARAVRRDARGAGRRVCDLPPAPARGTHAARRPRSRHRRDPRVAVLHLQQRAR